LFSFSILLLIRRYKIYKHCFVGYETRSSTWREENKLQIFENKMLRRCLSIKQRLPLLTIFKKITELDMHQDAIFEKCAHSNNLLRMC
jgi:hypothetical protein